MKKILTSWDQVGTEKDLSHLDTSLKEQFAERHIPEKVFYIRERNLGYLLSLTYNVADLGELQPLPPASGSSTICRLTFKVPEMY